ncbi:MAG TPA: hypothetical protein VFK16_06420 [Gemmatimonadaceae bacterium]|nr:hypothetical protein [Gemmatimonadaceae bacterium]
MTVTAPPCPLVIAYATDWVTYAGSETAPSNVIEFNAYGDPETYSDAEVVKEADWSSIASEPFVYFVRSPSDSSLYLAQFSMTGTPGLYPDPDTLTKMYDSLDTQVASANTLGTPHAWKLLPGRISSVSQDLLGSTGVNEGASATWRSYPDWDTTAYKYKWFVDGSEVSDAATYTTSFGSAGTHTIANVAIRGDNTSDSVVMSIKAFAAAINGPTRVRPFVECSWYGSASDGSSPYSYQWTGAAQHTGQYLTFENGSNNGEEFTLTLYITDHDGYKIGISRNVQVSSSAPICPD